MDCIALTDFVHGEINAVHGRPVLHRDGTVLSKELAEDLERAGLVRIQTVPAKKETLGKAEDGGAGQPSSASPRAPASPTKTSPSPKRGAAKTSKKGK